MMHSPAPATSSMSTTDDKHLDMRETPPPSPTYSDAVTASEGNEDGSHADLSPETKKESTSNSHGNVASHPKLGPALSNFLVNLAPYKSIMPEHLVRDMKNLEGISATMRQAVQDVK